MLNAIADGAGDPPKDPQALKDAAAESSAWEGGRLPTHVARWATVRSAPGQAG